VNFLQLAQKVREQAGISGDGPLAVTGQTAILAKIVNWVNEAWREIQGMSTEWWWLWNIHTFNTSSAKGDYTDAEMAITDKDRLDRTTVRIYKQSLGRTDEGFIPFIEYQAWLARYGAGTVDDNRPTCFTELPNGTTRFYPAPDDVYVVTFDYYRAITQMATNIDVPALPVRYHDLIWGVALRKYAEYDAAPEIFEKAQGVIKFWKNRLHGDRPKKMRLASESLDA